MPTNGNGTPLAVQFSDCSTDPEEIRALIATYREYNLEHHDRMVAVYPGVVDAVGRIREANVRTGLVTSKNRGGALRGLAIAGLTEMMDVLVCADEVTNPKPHPEPVEKAVKLLGGDGERRFTWETASMICTRAAPPVSRRPPRSGGPSAGTISPARVPTTGSIRHPTCCA